MRGIAASVVAGTAAGLIWYYFFVWVAITGGIVMAAIIGVAIGYLVGESVGWATNKGAGPPLQVIAAAGVALAYAIRVSLLLASDEWTVRTLFAIREFEILAVIATIIGGWVASLRVR